MKKIIALSLISFVLSAALSADPVKDIKAALKHVTVYPDRAQLTHDAAVEIPAGKTVLKLGSLSPYIDQQSIQVKGTGEFTILSVSYQNNYLQNLEDLPEIKDIRNQIETLQTKVEDEQAAIAVLKEKQSFLQANAAVLDKKTTFTVDQLKSVMDLYTSNSEIISTSILKKNRLIKDYQKQIEALQKQVADKTEKQQLPSGEISVTVTSEKPVSGKLAFSYVVSNAGWYPSYDVRVDDITKPVNIYFKANVFQNTGVEWKDVKLSFSNATPWVSGNIPVLYPWFIDYYQPRPVVRIRGAVSKSEAPAAMEMAAKDMVNEEAAPVAVTKQVGETTITFDVSVPCYVASDGKIQTIEIQRSSTQAQFRYVTVPRESAIAYLTANITDWAKLNLQSGEATLYFENTFVGKTTLDVSQLKDTLTLSLGNDNSILVKREKRQDFTSRKTLGANKTDSFSYLITIRNNKPGAIKMTVNDQVPVSSNSAITVEATELSGGKYNQQTGFVNWDLEIKPQETKQLVISYSVKYPKDKTIILE